MHNTLMHVYVHTRSYMHTLICTHTPILQIWLLQLGRETLAIFSCSAAGVDIILLKIFQELRLVK